MEQVETPIEEAAAEVTQTGQEEAQVEQPAEVAERDVDQDTLEIPDSSADGGKARYVPLSALDGARKELKGLKAELDEAKSGSAKAQQLESRIDELSAQLAQIAPKAQAYDAAIAAQQQRYEAPAEDDAEAVELAQTLDLYTPDGKPDIAKAKRTLALMDKRAGKQADDKVAPLAQHTVNQASSVMLARAKATAAPNGARPDPAILEQVWSRLDPRLTATVDGAKQAWNAALGFTFATQAQGTISATTSANRGTDGKFTKDIGAPLYTEKAGGKDTPDQPKLSAHEQKYIKDAGITEKEYLESAKGAPWLRK